MNFTSANYYLRLGLHRTATPAEVKAAFRSLARVYHPDVASNKTFAEEVFKRLNEAYETLSDHSKRRSYDSDLNRRSGTIPVVNPFASPVKTPASTPPPAPTRPSGFTGTESVGGSKTGFYASSPSPGPTPNRESPPPVRPTVVPRPHRSDLDIEAMLEIMLEDAIHGATYVITVQQNDAAARRQNLHSCRVQIPAGVYEGQKLRLKGLGYVDPQSFYLGDLFLTIRLARHKRFRVAGANLLTEVTISPWEAALGTRVRFPTLDGLADLHIPVGSQPGMRLRLTRYGLPNAEGTRGDLFVSIVLRVPVATSEKEKQLWKALAAAQAESRRG